jgi:rhamnose transport system ATP-binding protein
MGSHAPGSTDTGVALFEARDICKRFGAQVALDHVSLSVHAGGTHGLIGENGAGKTTLMNIFSGIMIPDAGCLYLNGEARVFRSAEDARHRGIMVVHQEPVIFPDLTVGENVTLANARWHSSVCGRRAIERFAQRCFDTLGIDIDPSRKARELTAGEGALVEIARAVDQNARLIIFDEPTSALSATEADMVGLTIRRLAATGVAVILISHRLGEVLALSDTITVLRDGRRVATMPTRDLTLGEAIMLMLGRAPQPPAPRVQEQTQEQVLLHCTNVCTGDARNVSFAIRSGEILGLAGLRGAGQVSVAEAIAGIGRITSGRIELRGQRINPRTRNAAGLSYLAEDRQREGLFRTLSVARNISVGVFRRTRWWSRLNAGAELALAEAWVDRLDIRPRDVHLPVYALSGGNQQKVLLARSLAEDPAILVLNNPGRGVDVGAKTQIYETIGRLRRSGLGILLVTDDLEEMALLGTRFCVFRHGRLVTELAAPVGPEDIALAISAND